MQGSVLLPLGVKYFFKISSLQCSSQSDIFFYFGSFLRKDYLVKTNFADYFIPMLFNQLEDHEYSVPQARYPDDLALEVL